MKHLCLVAVLITACLQSANAEGYNRVSVSYDGISLTSTNAYPNLYENADGFGLNYIHGFGIAKNMYIETGFSAEFSFSSADVTEDNARIKEQYSDINFQIPINYAYHIRINDRTAIVPYGGINFKLHALSKLKFDYADSSGKYDGIYEMNLFSANDMDGNDRTWNRFQMGAQVGVGLNYRRFYVGLQWGYDFIPYLDRKTSNDKRKVTTSSTKLAIGFRF